MPESLPFPDLTPPGLPQTGLPQTGDAALRPYGRRPSAGDFAYGSLRNAIISLSLPPGAPLSRAALAQQLGLSQTPVREALMRLQSEHLVEVVPSASTRVARIDLSSAWQAHFLRRSVELEMVRRLATELPPTLPAILERHLAGQRELVRVDDRAGLAEADGEFHGLLYEAANISGLWDLVRSRSGHLDRLRRMNLPAPGKLAAILEEHGLIAAAILAGDADAAERHLRRHFSGTFASIPAIRAERPAFFVD